MGLEVSYPVSGKCFTKWGTVYRRTARRGKAAAIPVAMRSLNTLINACVQENIGKQ